MRGFLLTLVVLFATATARDHHGHSRTTWGKNGDAELLLQANEASTLGLAGSRPTPIYPAATLPPLLRPPPLGADDDKIPNICARPLMWLGLFVTVVLSAPMDVFALMFLRYRCGCGRGVRTLSQRDRAERGGGEGVRW